MTYQEKYDREMEIFNYLKNSLTVSLDVEHDDSLSISLYLKPPKQFGDSGQIQNPVRISETNTEWLP